MHTVRSGRPLLRLTLPTAAADFFANHLRVFSHEIGTAFRAVCGAMVVLTPVFTLTSVVDWVLVRIVSGKIRALPSVREAWTSKPVPSLDTHGWCSRFEGVKSCEFGVNVIEDGVRHTSMRLV